MLIAITIIITIDVAGVAVFPSSSSGAAAVVRSRWPWWPLHWVQPT